MVFNEIISTVTVVAREGFDVNTNHSEVGGEFGVGIDRRREGCVNEQTGYIASHELTPEQMSDYLLSDPTDTTSQLAGKTLADLTINAKAVIIRQTRDRCEETNTFYLNVTGAAKINYNATGETLTWDGDLSIIPNAEASNASDGLTIEGNFTANNNTSTDSIMYVQTGNGGAATFNVKTANLRAKNDSLLTLTGTELTVVAELTARADTTGDLNITDSILTANNVNVLAVDATSCVSIQHNKIKGNSMSIDANSSAIVAVDRNIIEIVTVANITAEQRGSLTLTDNNINTAELNISLNSQSIASLSSNIITTSNSFNVVMNCSTACVSNTGIDTMGSASFTTSDNSQLKIKDSSIHAAATISLISTNNCSEISNSTLYATEVVINSLGVNSTLISGNYITSETMKLNSATDIVSDYTAWRLRSAATLTAQCSTAITFNTISLNATADINQSNGDGALFDAVADNLTLCNTVHTPSLMFAHGASTTTSNVNLDTESLNVNGNVDINAPTVDFRAASTINVEADGLLITNNGTVSINASSININSEKECVMNANNTAITAADYIALTGDDIVVEGNEIYLNAKHITLNFVSYKPPSGIGELANTTTGNSDTVTYRVKTNFTAIANDTVNIPTKIFYADVMDFTTTGITDTYTATTSVEVITELEQKFGESLYITACSDATDMNSTQPLSIKSNNCATIFFNLPTTVGYTIIYNDNATAAILRANNTATACFNPHEWWPLLGDSHGPKEDIVLPDGAKSTGTGNGGYINVTAVGDEAYLGLYVKKMKQSKINGDWNPSFRGGPREGSPAPVYANTSDGVKSLLRDYNIKELRTPNGVTWVPGVADSAFATLALMYPSTVVYGTIARKEGQCESDIRLKTNIAELSADEFIEKASKLRPVSYTMDHVKSDERIHGFIAQEVREIFPDLVVEDPDTGILSLKYIQLVSIVPILINKIDTLRKELERKLSNN